MPCVLLSIDLDDFKIVNDSAGHAAGDRLLITLAGFLKEGIRDGDAIIRIGGDEFLVLLRQTRLEKSAGDCRTHPPPRR